MTQIPQDILKMADEVLDRAASLISPVSIEMALSDELRIRDIYRDEISKSILSERERCLKVCQKISADSREQGRLRATENMWQSSSCWGAYADGCDACAAIIFDPEPGIPPDSVDMWDSIIVDGVDNYTRKQLL